MQRSQADNPGLAASRLGGIAKGRTPLHIVSDWPGYFPNGPRVASMLIEAGANLNARSTDEDRGETPLRWTASSDDADVASVLIDAGADLEVPGGSIGTPLGNAVGYSWWQVARLLVASAARLDAPWHAAALGCSGGWRNCSPATHRALLRRSLRPSGSRAGAAAPRCGAVARSRR